jgi:hypothetical protein
MSKSIISVIGHSRRVQLTHDRERSRIKLKAAVGRGIHPRYDNRRRACARTGSCFV